MGDTLYEMGDDLTADNIEERNQNAVEKFVNVIQDGLVGVLYIMGKDMKGSYFIAVLSMFVDCAQLCALATPTIFDTPGDSSFGETNMYLNPLHVFFDAFQFSQLSHLNYLFVPIALILVFMLLFNVMYVGYCWTYQMFNWLFIVRVLRSSATILTGVLYIPILTIFAGTVHCAGLDSSQCAIFRPFVALAAIFFIPFSLISTATFFDPRRDGGGPSTMPHARVITLHQLVRTILSILAATLSGSITESKHGMLVFWSILMTIMSACLVFSYLWLQPYYRHRFNSLRTALVTIVFWFSFCFAINAVWRFDPNQHSSAVLFYGGLCLILPLTNASLNWRKRILCVNYFPEEAGLLFGDMETELRVRFLLEQSRENIKREMRQTGSNNKKQQADLAVVQTKGATWYTKALTIYPNSALLCAMQAQYFVYDMNKPLLARKSLLEAESRGARLDVAFAIYKTKKYTEENASQNSDIMTWVACEKYWKLSRFYDKRCCVLLAEFWNALGETKLQVQAIQTLADQIALAVKEASNSYSKLIKLKPDDFEVLTIYAGFLDVIRNDPEQARKFKTRAEVIRMRNGKGNGKSAAFNDSDCSILRVDASGTSQNGIVLSANEVSGRIFNRPSSSLVGKVISSILLPPFTSSFDEIMDDYLQLGNEEYFNQNFDTFVFLDDKYVIMPCQLELKPFSTDGINFQVFVRVKQRRTSSSHTVLVDPETRKVIGMTHQARGSLQKDPQTHMESIEEIIPNYSRMRNEFLQPEGAIFKCNSMQDTILCIESIHLHGPESALVDQLSFNFPAGSDGPAPLEVYHTATAPLEVYHTATEGTAEDSANSREPSEAAVECAKDSDLQSLHPIREHSESLSQVDTGSGSDDEMLDRVNSEQHAASENEEAEKPTFVDETRMVVQLEDDDETAPLSPQQKFTDSFSPTRGSFGKAPSVASSGASRTSLAATRKVFLSSDGKLDPTLSRFRRLYKIFVFLTMIVIIALYLIRTELTKNQEITLNFTPKSGLRRYMAVRLAYMAHSLALVSQNISLPANFKEKFIRKQLIVAANKLQNLDGMLFEQKSTFKGELLDFYSNRMVNLVRTDFDGRIGYRQFTMFDASQAIASGGRLLAEKPIGLISGEDKDIFFLVQNVNPIPEDSANYPGFLQSLNATTRAFANLSQQTQASMDLVSVILAGIVVLGFLTLLVVMLLPLARGIDKSKVEVFYHLIGMPRSVFPAIAGRFSGRLLEVHDDDGDGGQVEVQEAIDNAATKRKAQQLKSGGGSTRSSNKEEEGRSVAAVESALRASSNKYRIIAKIGSSLVLLIAYFSCTLYWNFQTAGLLQDAPSVADYSGLRRATMLFSAFKIRLFLTGGSDFQGYDVSLENVAGTINEVDAIQESLLNGDKDRQLNGMLHTTSDPTDHRVLLFNNGCLKVKTPAYTGIPCSDFQHGLVADGLLSAYRTYCREALESLDYNMSNLKPDVTEAQRRLAEKDYIDRSELEEFYLQPSIGTSIGFYGAYQTYIFEDIQNKSMWACVIVVISLAICYYSTTRILYGLDNEIKRTRSLVFMIPDDVLHVQPKVKAFLSELARRQMKTQGGAK